MLWGDSAIHAVSHITLPRREEKPLPIIGAALFCKGQAFISLENNHMWYRNADRILEKPEYTFHATRSEYDHPFISPNSPLKSGAGGDAYGYGFYTSQNPFVIKGYSMPITRKQKLPKGTRLLIFDDISIEEAEEIISHVPISKNMPNDIFAENPKGSYTLSDIADFLNIEINYLSPILHKMGYDGMQYPAYENYTAPNEKAKSAGDNIVIFNPEVILAPKLFQLRRFRPDAVTPEMEQDYIDKHKGALLSAFNSGIIDFYSLPTRLRLDVDFARQAFDSGKAKFYKLPYDLRNDIDFARQAFENGKAYFYELPDALKSDVDFVLQAFEGGKVSFSELPDVLKSDVDFARQAYDSGKAGFHELPDALKNDVDFALQAFKMGKTQFSDLPVAVKSNATIATEALKTGKTSFYELPDALRKNADFARQAFESGTASWNELPFEMRLQLYNKL